MTLPSQQALKQREWGLTLSILNDRPLQQLESAVDRHAPILEMTPVVPEFASFIDKMSHPYGPEGTVLMTRDPLQGSRP